MKPIRPTPINALKALLILLLLVATLSLAMGLKILIWGFSDPTLQLFYGSYRTLQDKPQCTQVTFELKALPRGFAWLEEMQGYLYFNNTSPSFDGHFKVEHQNYSLLNASFEGKDDRFTFDINQASKTNFTMDLPHAMWSLKDLRPLWDEGYAPAGLIKYLPPLYEFLKDTTVKEGKKLKVSVTRAPLEDLCHALIDIGRKDVALKKLISVQNKTTVKDYKSTAYVQAAETDYQATLTSIEASLFYFIGEFLPTSEDRVDVFISLDKQKIKTIQMDINYKNISLPLAISFIDHDFEEKKYTHTIDLDNLSLGDKKRLIDQVETYVIDVLTSNKALKQAMEKSPAFKIFKYLYKLDSSRDYIDILVQKLLDAIQ